MFFGAFLFELVDRFTNVEYAYVSGILLAVVVFAATYFHNQVGLITLLIVAYVCSQNIETPEVTEAVIKEWGTDYIAHWNYSSRMTICLSVILFFTAIIIKRQRKKSVTVKSIKN